jgi:membrane-bound ClpP family serine protease
MRHYILSSTCVVACQADVIKHMLYRPILRGRIDKWAYALIEYDLTYESLRALKGQVLTNFIVEHGIELNNEINYLTFTP